jgi:hypothetical protein
MDNSDILAWRKSSHSNDGGCVEVATRGSKVFVRDSKERTGAVLEFASHEWTSFLASVRKGEFDLPQTQAQRQG